MQTFESVDAVLDFAMDREQEAADFYTELAGQMKAPWMQETFLSFAAEERGHKAKLADIKAGKLLVRAAAAVQDLRIGDYLVVAERIGGELDYQGALILAMKNEKAAFRLYSDLARASADDALRAIFEALAQEEAKHKLRFELEYDAQILSEN